jgi:hypothetical protein
VLAFILLCTYHLKVRVGTSTLKAEIYTALLHELMKSLCHFVSGYNECGNMVPLPSSVYVAFANPEMTRRIASNKTSLPVR